MTVKVRRDFGIWSGVEREKGERTEESRDLLEQHEQVREFWVICVVIVMMMTEAPTSMLK